MAAARARARPRGSALSALELGVPAQARGKRLDHFLAAELAASGLSRSRLKPLLDSGGVRVDGEVKPAKFLLKGGETVLLDPPRDAPTRLEAQDIAVRVLHEDEDLIVVDKPAGLVTHPGAGHRDGTLVNALLARCGPSLGRLSSDVRPGIVHRLDKGTSGCLVVAKSPAAFEALRGMVARHELTRIYLALAWGDFRESSGTIDAPLGRGPDRRRVSLRPSGGRAAVTHFTVRERYADACELECRLETGRTHQIRAHLRGIGHALVGDPDYGRIPAHLDLGVRARLAQVLERQALHAQRLEFRHPLSGKMIRAKAVEPADYRAARALLKGRA